MISTTAEYALRTIVFLAGSQDSVVSRQEIAEAVAVPVDYLHKVLSALDQAGIVEPKRGPGGGYRLIRDPATLTTLEVIEAVDTIPRIKRCPLDIPGHVQLCPLHRLLDEAAQRVEDAFGRVTISELARTKRSISSCAFPRVTS
ncbi:MAG: Rrf2 family transcriptional regulator [Pirellulaceae bacterium]|nr:Rrf2 family transcriptional regulator [Pirellulaceae bacterium]